MKKLERILACMNELSNSYRIKPPEKDLLYAAKKCMDIDVDLLEEAIDDMVSKFDTFPSIKAIKDFMRGYWISSDKRIEERFKRDAEHKKLFTAEKVRHGRLRKIFVDKLGEEKLEPYIKFWCQMYFGSNFNKNVIKAGLPIMLWEKCALFDWEKAKFDFNKLEHVLHVVQ